MATLTLRKLCKSYAHGIEIVRGIDLDVADGEFMVLVGPSGCGKSTLLRLIAGLEEISDGSLCIGGREVNQVSPAERGIAMVFQSYALYPHMTVRQNMGFGLKLAGKPAREVDREVERVAKVLRIAHLLEHKPKALSGGERQRVAIGRAIVRQPQVFLFDEPLSNLDASLRVQMRIELARLHQELGTTMIYVTHDQVEAMTLGQRIAVLNGGKLEQVGTPLELYRRPANLFVAGFLGTPKMNILPAALFPDLPARAAGAASVGVRPEHLKLVADEQGMAARIDAVEHLGDMQIAYASIVSPAPLASLTLHANQLAVRLESHVPLHTGKVIHVRADAADTLWFDCGGQALQAA